MDSMGKNVIEAIRDAKDITRGELAVMAGKDPSIIWQLEQGQKAKIPAELLKVIEALGYDPADVERQHQAWREQRAAELLATAQGK